MHQSSFIHLARESEAIGNFGEIHHIAVFRALKVGDLLCSIPFFRALRSHFYEAKITLISLPWAETLLQRFRNYIDKFIPFSGYPGLPEIPSPDENAIRQFFETVRQERFDLAIQLHGSGHIVNPLISEFRARQVAGFYLEGQSQALSPLFMPYPAHEHEVWRTLRLLEHLGVQLQGDALEFPLSEKDLRELLLIPEYRELKNLPYVCLHPGASSAQRQWNFSYFAEVGDRLYEQGYQVVLTGVSAEKELTAKVARQMRHNSYDFAKYGPSLGASARLIADARLIVANDTGIAHLAAALKVPSVIIFVNPLAIPYWKPLNPSSLVIVDGQNKDSLDQAIDAARHSLANRQG